MTTIDIIKNTLLNNPDIASVKLIGYDAQKDIKGEYSTSWTDKDELVYASALKLRDQHSLSFWIGIMAGCINNPNWSERCLTASLRHNPIHFIANISIDNIDVMDMLASENKRIAINSAVTLADGTEAHIPMLDFHLPFSDINTGIVINICRQLGESGYIMASGKSYHFIGKKLFGYNDMVQFMARALRFTPLVDEIWISHQLQDKSCSLRIGKKHGVVPTLICEI